MPETTAYAPRQLAARRSHQIRADIQGLRGLAVLLVVLYHADVPFLTGGYVGVDVFFVISGFLISKHLLEAIQRDGRVSFAQFYARRVRRLLPAALVVIALTVLSAIIWVPPLQLRAVFTEAIAATLYVPNILFAAQGTNYLAEGTPSLFQQYWSLGVEEQFYLVWPAVLAAAIWLSRKRPWTLWLMMIVLIVLSFAGSLVLSQMRQPFAFFLLPARAWEFGFGALVALATLRGYRDPSLGVSRTLGWAGVVLIAGSGVVFDETTLFPGYAALAPVIGTALVILVGSSSSAAHTAAVQWRPLRFLGDISYSLYLVHWPLLVLPQAAVGQAQPLPWWTTAALAGACLPVAWLLHRFVERRFIDGGRPTAASARRALLVSLLATSLLAAAFSGGQFAASKTPLDSGSPARNITATSPPISTPYVPSNMEPDLRSAADDVPELYATGCHLDFAEVEIKQCVFGATHSERRVALFGDSHAAQWFPALDTVAKNSTFRLETHTKSSCPSVAVPSELNDAPYQACIDWRENVLRHLVANPPSLVVISNFGAPTASGTEATAGWEEGLRSTLLRLQPVTEVVVIADTPNLRQTPSICLSAHLDEAEECAVARSEALDSPARSAEQDAVTAAQATMVNLTDYLCTASRCPAIIGNNLVYRDAHHLTVTFSEKLSDTLGQRILSVMPS